MNVLQTVRTEYRVSDFVSWQRDGALVLSPYFQRRSVWKKLPKSYLIDTILRGLPIPIIFLRDRSADLKSLRSQREVVDGQQRLRTILGFIDPTLLPDFDPQRDEFTIDEVHNAELAGKSFAALDPEYRQQVLDYQFSVQSFPSDTDDRQILQIFARMNATGLRLNRQELRNAEFFGAFKTLAYALAAEQYDRWTQWGLFSAQNLAQMLEVELMSEFLLLVMHGEIEKDQKLLDDYYEKYDAKFAGAEAARRIRATFDLIEDAFGDSVKMLFSTRTLFYALFTIVYGLAFEIMKPVALKGKLPKLVRAKATALKASTISRMKRAATKIKGKDDDIPPLVAKALRGASNDVSQRRLVIAFLAGADDPCPKLP